MQCIGAVEQIIQKIGLYHCQLLYNFSEKWYAKQSINEELLQIFSFII
jgi:hypothetical protein